MKSYAVALLAGLIVAVAADETYNGKWNKIDHKPIIDNVRLFSQYKDCILGKKTSGCPSEAQELKRILPEALKETCAKCSPEQQDKIREVLSYICEKRPETFTEFLTAFDPDNQYRPAFETKFGKLAVNC